MPKAHASTLPPRDALLEAVGASVRALREQQGLSRRGLSERCGVSERFLADLEGGQGNISVARLSDVARALGTTAGALLDQAEPPAGLHGLLSSLSRDEQHEAERWLTARFRSVAGPVVALVGLRGAGKSTIGRRVAEELRLPFSEQDELVEQAAGLSLATIFALHGEAYYRRLAREVLTRFLADTDAGVLAAGGGLVADREAWRLVQKRCRTVWLQATPEDHWQRVLEQGDLRPGGASENAQAELRALLQAREPLYAQADLAVDTSALGVERAVQAILRHLELEKSAATRRGARSSNGSAR